ncbi:unnamed protein product [[Candida] boidinii]|nr:unnamed protein product [[Candida] boidinii]
MFEQLINNEAQANQVLNAAAATRNTDSTSANLNLNNVTAPLTSVNTETESTTSAPVDQSADVSQQPSAQCLPQFNPVSASPSQPTTSTTTASTPAQPINGIATTATILRALCSMFENSTNNSTAAQNGSGSVTPSTLLSNLLSATNAANNNNVNSNNGNANNATGSAPISSPQDVKLAITKFLLLLSNSDMLNDVMAKVASNVNSVSDSVQEIKDFAAKIKEDLSTVDVGNVITNAVNTTTAKWY